MSEKHIAAELRRAIRDQADGICEYCRSQERFSPQRFSIEHIKPYSAGGQPTQENLALSCQGCNGHKYTKQDAPDPVTGDVVKLFHPRKQRWRSSLWPLMGLQLDIPIRGNESIDTYLLG